MSMGSVSYWNGKVAIVTGASSGLGQTIADRLGAAGARVAIAARGIDALEATAAGLRAKGYDVSAIAADVTDQASVERLVRETVERYGRLDLLVNNAGKSMRRAAIETTPEDFREQFDLNVIAAVRTTRASAPHLIESGGHLVNIASLAGKAPARYMGAYGPSKAALVSYTEQLRLELGDRLHVLLVCPGPIARDEPRARSPEELKGLPPSAAQPGGGVKTGAIRPERLAGDILRACEKRQLELIYPWAARIVFALMQLSPRLMDILIRKTS
jgi:NAD(P)-dependent dehydrogenase (short-subunit alcohol dehydrogenase family)